MRVISGVAKGVSLFGPRDTKTRPTSDFIKENLFNIIRDDVCGAKVLDLFAGSGAIGIEALSRGAAKVIFVDASQKCVDLVKRNLEKARLNSAVATVLKGDALLMLKKLAGQKFDIIFLDPPYFEEGFVEKALREICDKDILADSGYIILEMSRTTEPPKVAGLDIFDEREYSGTRLVFMEKSRNEEGII